jgi:hypothetical protein
MLVAKLRSHMLLVCFPARKRSFSSSGIHKVFESVLLKTIPFCPDIFARLVVPLRVTAFLYGDPRYSGVSFVNKTFLSRATAARRVAPRGCNRISPAPILGSGFVFAVSCDALRTDFGLSAFSAVLRPASMRRLP